MTLSHPRGSFPGGCRCSGKPFFLPTTGSQLEKNLKKENGLLTVEFLNLPAINLKSLNVQPFGLVIIVLYFSFFYDILTGFLQFLYA